jgi:hypothetical protein
MRPISIGIDRVSWTISRGQQLEWRFTRRHGFGLRMLVIALATLINGVISLRTNR